MTRSLCRALVIVSLTLVGNAFHTRAQDRPNVLIILADDFGWGDTSCNNPDAAFQTPNIDRVAHEGARFTNAHTPHAVCSPTRYALLTGRYAWRTEMREGVLPGYAKALIRPGRLTLASMLKKHGYRTGVFGKWHLGLDWVPVAGDPGDWHWGTQVLTQAPQAIALIGKRVDHTQPVTVGPTHIGFDKAFITPSNNIRIPIWFEDDRVVGNPAPDNIGTMRDPEVQRDTCDDFHVARAIDFLDDWKRNHAAKPFFLYLPLNAIHGATLAPQRFVGKTKDGRRGDKVLWLDESIGKIEAALQRLGVRDDTLVIFTSDNGPIPPQRYNVDSPHRAAGPFRGYKTDAWEGGCRVPFLVRWPGRIQPGTVRDQLLSLTDVMATLAALVGHDLPEWAGEDSFNQLPLILGQTDRSARPHLITQSNVGATAIRK
ncbi:MAG: sulfatase family protein, partial [Planctomycetota bacterium]